MAGYILDFYCEEARLRVELDGTGHVEFSVDRDWIRDATLQDMGILTLRRTNDEIAIDPSSCFFRIRDLCERRSKELRPDRDEEGDEMPS